MFDLILVIVVVFVLLISSIIDMKTREVPDELSIGLIAVAVILKILHAYEIDNFLILLNSLFGFLIFLGISLIMYYTRQWGGGDAKLFMALGIALPYYPTELILFNPGLKIIILSMHNEATYVKEAFAAGAIGYVTKSSPTSEIKDAVYKALNNETYLCREMCA